MKIVVLDGHTLNPGDLSWDGIKTLGPCEIFERSAPAEIVPRLQGAAATLTNKVAIDRKTMESLPELKYIGVTATGDAAYGTVDYESIFAVGALLFVLTLAMNAVAIRLVRRFREEYE